MENNFDADRAHGPDDHREQDGSPPSAAEARAALADLDTDGARLAQRMVTPWWYHPALGVIVAVVVGAQALPGTAVVVPLAVIAMPFLVIAYTSRYGVSATSPAGPRSKRLLLAILGVLVLAMAAGLVVKLSDSSAWWVLLPAALAFVATIVLGRRYDSALRDEVAGSASTLP